METYYYYSTQRPAAPGTCPKNGVINVENYPQRKYCPEIHAFAWGRICYDRQLTEKETADYELKPAESIQTENNPYHQIDMFELMRKMSAAKTVQKVPAAKKQVPEDVQKLTSDIPLQARMNLLLNIRGKKVTSSYEPVIQFGSSWAIYRIMGDKVMRIDKHNNPTAPAPDLIIHNRPKMAIYIDDDGDVWSSNLEQVIDQYYGATCGYKFSPWKKEQQKLLSDEKCFVINDTKHLERILHRHYPYAERFVQKQGSEEPVRRTMARLICAPMLEQLVKADYAFAESVLYAGPLSQPTVDSFNRLVKRGGSPKDIFKTSKGLRETLKYEANLEVWDVFRKMEKFGRISRQDIKNAYDAGYTSQEIATVSKILSYTWDNKPVFTYQKLSEHLQKLEMSEAIDLFEGLPMLENYLRMCKELGQKPRIQNDSLKKEHDVTARILWQMKNSQYTDAMKKNCKEAARNNYSENVFFIRAIESYEDLLKESAAQHANFGIYASLIARGRSKVYVMREKARPEKSLVTIALLQNEDRISMRYSRGEYKIHNKAQNEFLKRWMEKVKERNITGAESISVMGTVNTNI